MEDADTVNTAPTAVRKKREERADRRVPGVMRRVGSGSGMVGLTSILGMKSRAGGSVRV